MQERIARELTARILALAQEQATELAPSSMAVPTAYYRDRTLWQWERGELLRAVPVVVAPSTQIPRPGDYHVRRLLDTSVLVVRDRDGRVHVLQNYCRHRGARIADGSGNRTTFVCPYHHWSYGCDGRLLGRPRSDCFDDLPADDQAPADDQGLVALPSEERSGLIWCVLDPEAEIDVGEHLGSLEPELEPWSHGRCPYIDHRELEVAVNWKAGLENFADFYHVPTVHANSAASHVGDSAAFDRFGRHHRLVSGMGSLRRLSARTARDVGDDSHLIVAYWIHPNLIVTHQRLTIDLVQFWPGAEPGTCTMRHTCLARRPSLGAAERSRFQRIWEAISEVFTGEDAAALERVGDGIAHTARDRLLIGRNEPGVQHIIRTLQDAAREGGH